jgi:hypothetical protein
MATKSTATSDECYNRLEPDEPYFCLMARDPDFEVMVRTWALHRRMQISSGARENTLQENHQIAEALNCAQDGKAWREEYLVRKAKQEGLEFDIEGRPTTGPHMRKQTTTTGHDIISRKLPEALGLGDSIQEEAAKINQQLPVIGEFGNIVRTENG